MSSATLTAVVEQVKSLTDEEKRELKTVLDDLMETSDYERKWRLFAQRMVEKGYWEKMPGPRMTAEEFEAFKAVEVEGEPMSVTVIKERR